MLPFIPLVGGVLLASIFFAALLSIFVEDARYYFYVAAGLFLLFASIGIYGAQYVSMVDAETRQAPIEAQYKRDIELLNNDRAIRHLAGKPFGLMTREDYTSQTWVVNGYKFNYTIIVDSGKITNVIKGRDELE